MEIKFEKLKNVRDIGGEYAGCVKVRTGCFIRGKRLSGLTEKDREKLMGLGIKTVIDLRSREEKERKPDDDVGAKYLFLPVFEGDRPGITHAKDRLETLKNVPPMEELYRLTLEGECLENQKKIVRALLTCDYPVYFHCTEGKDRTGIAAAIILMLLGVTDEEIARDYLLTNKTSKKRARRVSALIFLRTFSPSLAKKAYGLYVAKRQYLDVLFKMVRSSGGRDRFFREKLGLSDEEIASFRLRLVSKEV